MKKIYSVLFILMFVLIFVSIISGVVFAEYGLENLTIQQPQQLEQDTQLQWLTVINPRCPCVEGANVTFDISIKNIANRTFTINGVALVDASNVIFSSTLTSIALSTGEEKNISIIGALPPATRGKSLYYVPCFAITDAATMQSAQSCENIPRRILMTDNTDNLMNFIYIIIILLVVVLVVLVLLFLSIKNKLFLLKESKK